VNALQEEVINWIALMKQADSGLEERDRDLIKAIVSDLLECRAKDIDSFIAKTYPEAN
jgi:hypothetical protein